MLSKYVHFEVQCPIPAMAAWALSSVTIAKSIGEEGARYHFAKTEEGRERDGLL